MNLTNFFFCSALLPCILTGLKLTTGVVTDIKKRCNIYRKRIEDFLEKERKRKEARDRNEKRAEVHKLEKLKVKGLTADMVMRQCFEACHAGRYALDSRMLSAN
jgi:hypothetical protein